MPRYYFHSVDHDRYVDGDGLDLSDEAAALRVAADYAGQLLQDLADGLPHETRVQVTDEVGTPVFEIVTSVRPLPVGR